MTIDAKARQKIEEAVQGKKDQEEKADAAIWAAVALNAGL